MSLFFLRIYVTFQSLFQGKGKPQITYWGSLKKYIGQNKGKCDIGSPWKECTYFS